MAEHPCDGCMFFHPENRNVQCFNITMINRGPWHPDPTRRCNEYSRGTEALPGDNRPKVSERTVSSARGSRKKATKNKSRASAGS